MIPNDTVSSNIKMCFGLESLRVMNLSLNKRVRACVRVLISTDMGVPKRCAKYINDKKIIIVIFHEKDTNDQLRKVMNMTVKESACSRSYPRGTEINALASQDCGPGSIPGVDMRDCL